MKYLLFLLLSVSCLAQNDFNKLDENGKKNGVWKGYYEESKRQRYEGTFDHGIETGTFNYFDDTNAKTIIATRAFSENGTVAYTILYDREKNIVSEGKTVNRLNEGEWKYYHEASKDLMSIEIFVKGKLSGLKKVFYKNNILAEESYYLNGLKNGSYKKYTEKGIVLEESNYKNGEYDGIVIFRDALGNISSKGPYVNGLKKGKWQFYVKGKLKKEEIWPIVKYIGKHKRKQS